ncbi:hypothetical protein [Dysgonomonas sp. 520]|uniref:hypothetical protein n=1 Tax=Dysgonomonas sp. 520 TaxID=2302931 RepID=UPI0013D768EC|nr:hypothetical protein [Dysgonomonas sp. 520]
MTEYFTGIPVNHTQTEFERSLAEAKRKRDLFLENNRSIIARLDSEDLVFAPYGNGIIVPIIKLSYYKK